MKNVIRLALISSLLAAGSLQAAEATSPPVVQVFGCSLNEGASYDSVWNVMDILGGSVSEDATADPAFGIFLWTPFRGVSDLDFVFGVINSSLTTMGEGLANYLASPTSQIVSARLASIADCGSGIFFTERAAEGVVGMTADRQVDALVETFACRYTGDANAEDRAAAVKYYQGQMEKLGSAPLDKYGATIWTPYRGGPGTADFYWVGTYPDLPTWIQGETAYVTSKEGAAADARFNEMSQCSSSLWTGYWVHAPKEY